MTKLTDQEVLQKCIERAIDNGFDTWKGDIVGIDSYIITGECFVYFDYLGKDKPKKKSARQYGIYSVSLCSIIFTHEFAKALFGEKLLNFDGTKYRPKKLPYGVVEVSWTKPAWQYHLQQLVIAEDRIDYLRKWLND